MLVGLHPPVRVGEAGGVAHGQVGLRRGPHEVQLALGEAALEAGRRVRELEGAGAACGGREAPGERLPLGRSFRDHGSELIAPTTAGVIGLLPLIGCDWRGGASAIRRYRL